MNLGDGATFDPGAIIYKTLVEDYLAMLHIKYLNSVPCGLLEDFLS